ncbi:MAG: zinc ABC transporter ATP-binding protein ZnuC [Desulfuromonadaceae bacterium]
MKDRAAELLLEVSDVQLVLGGRTILEQIQLQVRRGEILTLVGPNGAGKTTLLRVMLGLLPATSGRVYRRPKLRVGYMPQRLHLDPVFPLTVQRFLAMAGTTKKDKLLACLQEVGAAQVFEAAIQTLSGGELQRVLLARALLRQPDLLILDEPVQGVDVHGQVELYRLIAEIRQRYGCAVLMVSHDLHLVMAATDRVLCLNRHICCSGTPGTVTSDPAFIRLFGPLAAESLAIYSHDRDHRHDDCAAHCREVR